MKKTALSLMRNLLFLMFIFSHTSYVFSAEVDNRIPVQKEEAALFPYNLAHKLDMQSSRGNFSATGTLINNSTILTAGHVVADPNGNLIATSVTAYQGFPENNFVSSAKKKVVRNPFKVRTDYKGERNKDTALIQLQSVNSHAQQTPKNVRLAIYKNLKSLVGKQVTIVSYTNHAKGLFIKSVGQIFAVNPQGLLFIDTFSSSQQSGSAIYLDGRIIGTLTAPALRDCSETCSKTIATAFTLETKQYLFDPNGVTNVDVID